MPMPIFVPAGKVLPPAAFGYAAQVFMSPLFIARSSTTRCSKK